MKEELNNNKNSEKKININFNDFDNNKFLVKEKIEQETQNDINYLTSNKTEKPRLKNENFKTFFNRIHNFIENFKSLLIILKNKKHSKDFSSKINSTNFSNDINDDIKIFERIDNEILKFEYLINQNFKLFKNSEKDILVCNNSINYEVNKFNNYSFVETVDDLNNINVSSMNKGFTENNFLSLIASKEKNKELEKIIIEWELKNKNLEEQLEILKYNYNSELKNKFSEDIKIHLNSNFNLISNDTFYQDISNPIVVNFQKQFDEEKKNIIRKYEKSIECIQNLNKDLEEKNNQLEGKLEKSEKKQKIMDEISFMNEILNSKIQSLEIEINDKSSIINYLEKLLMTYKSKYTKLNSKLFKSCFHYLI